MKEEAKSARWWSIYEAAVTGLACGGHVHTIVEEATRIANLSLDEAPEKLAVLQGTIAKVETCRSNSDRPSVRARVDVGGDALSIEVPADERLQPGDRVVCSIAMIH